MQDDRQPVPLGQPQLLVQEVLLRSGSRRARSHRCRSRQRRPAADRPRPRRAPGPAGRGLRPVPAACTADGCRARSCPRLRRPADGPCRNWRRPPRGARNAPRLLAQRDGAPRHGPARIRARPGGSACPRTAASDDHAAGASRQPRRRAPDPVQCAGKRDTVLSRIRDSRRVPCTEGDPMRRPALYSSSVRPLRNRHPPPRRPCPKRELHRRGASAASLPPNLP